MEHATRATAVPDPVPIHTLAYRSAKRRAAALGCNRAALASVPRRHRYTSIQVAAAEALRLRPLRLHSSARLGQRQYPSQALKPSPALMSVALGACSVDDQTMISCWNPQAHPPSNVPQPAAGEHGDYNEGVFCPLSNLELPRAHMCTISYVPYT
jgi:hypothetical protein